MPSKNDEDPSPADAGAESTGKKKPVRRRTTRAPSTRTKSAKAAKAEASSAQLELAPAPEPAAPPPAVEPPRREERTEREERPQRAERPERAEREPDAAPARSVNLETPAGGGDNPPTPETPAASSAPAQEASRPSGGQHHQPHQQPQGEWQERGGGRDFWKRNKRKRGRHGGGPWQQGGPGREQHPPQPPPPSNAPVAGELPNPSRFEDLAALENTANEVSSGGGEPIYLNEVYAKNLGDLTAYARQLGASFEGVPNKKQLLTAIFAHVAERKRPLKDRGYIDVTDRGSFIVHDHVNYRLYPEDPYLPESLVKLHGLKRGHQVEVLLQTPQPGERCPSVLRVESVMGMPPADISKITPFEELVPYYPLQRILLESEETQKDVSMRAIDILTPIGFGQRALIVAPPRTGKTVLLQNIANSITANSPHAKLILLLIDERPEEVTDFRRHTKGEVVSSTFDETPESHVHCAEMVIENARRRVELGEHVVILLDSITRLARAYNALTTGGKTMSGGLESNALQKPKRFFGSARNIEGGGSLTIIASALIDTGSRMDEIIFEEFKGTGNCEVHLDRGLVERRIFPAINIDRSGTRKEELIYHPEELQRIYGLRRAMQGLGPIESMEMLITRLRKTKSNAEFLLGLSRT